jgi:hypothetical protein
MGTSLTNTVASVERLDVGNDAGSNWGGAATDKLGCYGVTPVVQAASVATVTTTAATSTTNAYGYTTAAQADAIVTAINAVVVAVKNFGITSAT